MPREPLSAGEMGLLGLLVALTLAWGIVLCALAYRFVTGTF